MQAEHHTGRALLSLRHGLQSEMVLRLRGGFREIKTNSQEVVLTVATEYAALFPIICFPSLQAGCCMSIPDHVLLTQACASGTVEPSN